jgi:autotransporter passenger strand-loop-strand repeat protein
MTGELRDMSGSGGTSTLTAFTSGDLVISVYGDGDGSGTYTDNQASPIVLEELTTSGTAVGQMVLPQATMTVNGTTEYAISGEYGSSSEGTLQLSADGQSLVIMGYGVNAQTFNTGGAAVYGNAALAQSTSVPGGSDTPVARVVADIGYNGSVDTSTALYNIDNTNNPRSVATVNGTTFYIAGQGVKGDTTQGLFIAQDGASNPTAIDTSTDVRTAEIYNGELYVSRDSTQGSGGTSNISSYGTGLPTGPTSGTVLTGIDGSLTLTAAQANTVDGSAIGTSIHLSPENFFFADADTLYVADGGNPKEGGLGDGGLQKWVFNGSTWTLEYTLSVGLNLVADTAASGTTGLIGLTGTVVGGNVELYATNATIGDLDPTYVFGITDTLASTTGAGESFTTLMTAAPDTNIRGIAFAPSASNTAPSVTSVTSGSTQSGIVVTSGSALDVLSGGTAVSATVLSGGSAVIALGGVDSGSTVAHGGMETVLGSATGDQIDGVQLVSNATAIVSHETVYNGGSVDLFLKGASADDVTVMSGGSLNISGNATASNTVIEGGVVNLESPMGVLAGSLTFDGPGTLEFSAVISAGFGVSATISGFGVGDVIDETGFGPDATFSATVSGGNTVATITSGTVSESFTFAGSIASDLSFVPDGGAGMEIGFNEPPPVVTSVASGTTSSGIVVSGGGSLDVLSGGTIVSGSVLSGGTAVIASGGFDSGSTVANGGNETVLGSATDDQVFGVQLVSNATAVVSNETVHSGGSVDLFLKGATARSLTVLSGGTLNISGNATTSDTVISGGVIDLQSPKGVLAGSVTFAGPGTIEFTDVISAGFGDLAVISGFGTGDVIDETLFGSGTTMSTSESGGETFATVTSGGISEQFTFAGSIADNLTLVSDGRTGEEIAFTVCFLRGTQIATPGGEVAVERLAVGDSVMTADGKAEPIVWIGVGRTLVTPARRSAATPVIVRKGALADNVPHRDLRVTKGHSLLLDGVLIPVEFLVNHRSILWDDRAREVEIYHVELVRHGVLLADGAPAESYRDDGNRWLFHNGNANWHRPPMPPCAPVLTGGPLVDAAWRRLLERAGARPGVPTTDDPDLHLMVDGRRVDCEGGGGDVRRFRLPEVPRSVRIASRVAVPAELGLARDPRPLGVALRQVRLWQGARLRVIEASDDSLATGFHLFEAGTGWRWTDGDALLPAALFDGVDGGCELELRLAGSTQYPLFGEMGLAAA